MPIPEKREDLVAMGYVFDNEAVCRGCGARIEWWITPRGKKMPMRVFEEGTGIMQEHTGKTGFFRRPHWADCPDSKGFRK